MDQKFRHFYNRAAFGVYPGMSADDRAKNFADMLPVAAGQKAISVVNNYRNEMNLAGAKGDPARRKALKEQLKQDQALLNTTWIGQMEDRTLVLREKMTLFWHDHFACRIRSPYLAQQQNNTLRTHALGNFRDLLMAVSKDAAMLQFLNNQQNKKDSPNENFAREVMELFTLGRAQYSEDDIRNAARAFTGWTFNPQTGEFVFRQRVHDYGAKTFRGKTGNFSGKDIIAMILEDRKTAHFITLSLWQFFADSAAEEEVVSDLAKGFYDSGYNISLLLQEMFASTAFNNARYTGNRIKSPVELIVGAMVHTGGKFNNPANLLFLQRAMGQVLFQPPNVGGWPRDKAWIDSSSLAFRMSLPAVLLQNSETEFETKDDGDVNNVTNSFDNARRISFSVDWQKLGNIFTKNSAADTLAAIAQHLMARPVSATNMKIVHDRVGKSKDDQEFIKNAFIAFMSLPEYQLS